MYSFEQFPNLRPICDIEYEYLEAQLNKIGKRMFVEHFYSFKRHDNSVFDKCPENLQQHVFRRRVLAAFAVFETDLALHALYKIINSPQIEYGIKTGARQILEYELFMSDFTKNNA